MRGLRGQPRAWLYAASLAAVVVLVVGGLLISERSRSQVRASRDDMAALARAAGDAQTRTANEVDQAERRRADITSEAAAALASREIQRERLRDQGLSELTVEKVVQEVLANADLVEWRRQQTSAVVDRQAREIPEMENCMAAARRAINSAFNVTIDPNVQVPGPSAVCEALLAAPAP